MIIDGRHRAVRHVALIHHLRTGHDDDAPHIVVRLANGRTSRVDYREAIDVEVIAIGAWLDGIERDRPHVLVPFFQVAGAIALDIAATPLHALGLRGEDAERDLPIGRNLRRDNIRPALPSAGPSRRGLGTRCWH